MANPVIATVQSVTAPISVRDEAGSLRQLSVGDQLRLGDLVLTESGQAANLLMTDGTVVTLTGAKETLVSNDLMATTASSAEEAVISEASLDQLINEVRDQVATNTPEADQILAALQGDGPLDDLLEETAAGLTGEGEGEGHSFVILDRIDEQIELALTTTTPFIVTEEQEPFEGVQSASFNLTTESDVAPNIAQFTDNFVNGVSYTTSSGLTGLTGDAGEPGSFRYNDGDTITFSIGAVIIAEFSADLIQGPYLFIQDLKGLSLSETNDQFVENVAIFLQALDSDLDDGNNIDGLQTQDISAEEASVAFSNYIEITAAIRTLFENYVDPATGQALNLMNSGKGQVSDALSKAGVEFTAKSEMEGVSYEVNSANGGTVVIDEDGNFTFTPNGELSGEQAFAYTVTNNSGDTFEMTRVVNLSDTDTLTGSVRMNSFETLAMQHVVDTISELAGERDPETMDARTEDTWGWFEEGTESDRVVNYSTAPETLEIDDSGIKFVVDASMLAYGYVPKQINDDSMMNNMELSDVSVRLLDNDGAPIANRSLSIEFDAETKTGVVTLSADDETSLDDLAAEVEDGLLENLAFDYTIWDWTVPVKVEGAGAIDAYKSHLSANPADIVEDGVYSQFVVNSTLAFDEAQKLTVKFSPEGSGTDFAEYSDDFSVPIQYRNGDGEWVDMQVLDETYTRADYDKPLPIFEFELAAGSTAVEIRIPVFDDPYIESTEIIDMLVEGDNFYSENIQAKIIDNDTANTTPIVEVNFAVVNEDDGYASLTFSLVDQDGNLVTDTSDTTITYQTADLSAKAGLDYTAIPNDGDTGTALIIAGESTVTIQVPIIDDSIIEQTEFFKIDVLSVSDNAVLGDPEASVRIYDNDGMTITGDAQQEGTNITYTVVLSSELPSGEKTITLTPTNSGATASVHDDYSLTPVSVTYTDGDLNTQTISANSDGTFTLPDEVTTFQASYSTVIDNTPDGGVNTSGDETARLQVQVEYQSGPETLTVTGLGEATILDANSPEADSVEVTGGEDDSFITITLVGSDIDLNDSIETFTLSNLPANGTLYTNVTLTTLAAADTSYAAIDDELTLYFVPDENWNGETNFNFTANDSELDSEPATATIKVTPVNDRPTIDVTANDFIEDAGGLVAGTSVAGTYTTSDEDGDSLTVTFNTASSHYTLDTDNNQVLLTQAGIDVVNAGGDLDAIDLKVSDGSLDDTSSDTPYVTETNDPSVVIDDIAKTNEDTAVDINVLANDTDIDGPVSIVESVTQGLHGSVNINANGTVKYTPIADYSGSDSFTYTNTEGETATVNVSVNAVADIADDTAAVTEDTPTVINVLGNDTFENSGREVTAVGTASNGSVSLVGGVVTYTPDANYNGADSFTYTVTSGGVTETATVNVTVGQVNDPGTFGGDTSGSGNEDSASAITGTLTFTDSKDGATNPNFTVTTAASNGTATINATTGAWSYTPNADYNGSDSFVVSVTDDDGNTETQEITLSVGAVVDIADDSVTVDEDSSVTTDVLDNDTFEGSNPTITAVGTAANGTVEIVAGAVKYTPNTDFNGTDSYTYTVTSGGVTETATVNVTVDQAVANVAPDTNDSSVVGNEDSTISIPTLSGSDSDGSVDSFVIKSLPANGSLYVDGTEVTTEGTSVALANADKLTFEPAADWNGDTSFTYSAVDDDGVEDATPATISISVAPTSDVFQHLAIQVGTEVEMTGGLSDLAGADGKSTFYSNGITLTASEGMNFNSGNGLGVGPNNAFRIAGNDTVTVEYDSPLMINQVNLWVKNNVEEDVQIAATINVDGHEYTVQANAREAGNGGNAAQYSATLKLLDSEGVQVGDAVTSTTENTQLTLNSVIGGTSYQFSVTPSFTSGNDDDEVLLQSSVEFSKYVVSNGPDGEGDGFTIGQIGTDTSTPLFYEYPLALEALSTDSTGNEEALNSTFTIGGLKSGDSIVFGSNIFEADSDGNITLVGAELFNDINSDDDELTLRTSESLPDGYELSLTVSSTENGHVMITSKGGTANDSFTGGDYADYLSGGAGDDNLIGGKGEDMLTGGLGDDVFAWTLADADGGNDTVTDFGTGSDGADSGTGVDALDLRDLLQSEDGSSASNLLGYIHISKVGNDTIVKIDADGGSDFDNYDQQITLEGIDLVTGHVDQTAMINDLLSNGKLITD